MVMLQKLKWYKSMQYCKRIKVSDTNKITTYTPIRSTDVNKDIDWQSVVGVFLSKICNKNYDLINMKDFEKKCKEAFFDIFNEENDWDLVKNIYFNSNDIYKISPDFLILKSKDRKLEQHNVRIAEMYLNFFDDKININFENIRLNFIEKELNNILNKTNINDNNKHIVKEEVYLPYISKNFRNDLIFISNNLKYFTESIENFLKLYAFLYTSQLALNLYDIFSEPEHKELYFILESEKASGERSSIKQNGYTLLYKRLKKVFPLLSINEQLQNQFDIKLPFWKFYRELEDNEFNKNILNIFLEDFMVKRGFNYESCQFSNLSLNSLLKEIIKIAENQFSEEFSEINGSRPEVNEKSVNAYIKNLCKEFIQYRGAAGATLVINFDFFLLLTNLCIGENEKLRLNELLIEMRKRGIYFDKKSLVEIINFYERVGNVERMSDSGDAIYVKKTI